MTAQILDGTATLKTIKAELAERVAALEDRGIVPGLGTVLVGDDPGSHWYVGAKHKDCAEIGITSHPHELSAGTTQTELLQLVQRLNNQRDVHGILVQLPLPEKFPKPTRVHAHQGEPCPRCGTTLEAVFYEDYVMSYCPHCQTEGRVLKDRRLSRLLK